MLLSERKYYLTYKANGGYGHSTGFMSKRNALKEYLNFLGSRLNISELKFIEILKNGKEKDITVEVNKFLG